MDARAANVEFLIKLLGVAFDGAAPLMEAEQIETLFLLLADQQVIRNRSKLVDAGGKPVLSVPDASGAPGCRRSCLMDG